MRAGMLSRGGVAFAPAPAPYGYSEDREAVSGGDIEDTDSGRKARAAHARACLDVACALCVSDDLLLCRSCRPSSCCRR